MILDKENELSAEQAVTVTAKSTNTIDFGPNSSAGNSVGAAPCYLHCEVTIDETFTAAGAGTLVIAARSSPNSDMSSPTVHYSTAAQALAALDAGDRIPFDFIVPNRSGRYFDLHYTVATGPMTAGKISAVLGFGPQSNR